MLVAALFAGLVAAVLAQSPVDVKNGTVYFNSETKDYRFVAGIVDRSGAAYGSYDSGVNHPSNFGVLKIESNATYEDNVQMFAAGYLEGALTQSDIYDMYVNMLSTWSSLRPSPPANLTKFLAQQDQWVRENIQKRTHDPYWVQLGGVMAQYDGLRAGYSARADSKHELDPFAFFLLNGCGDLFDLIPATSPKMAKNPFEMEPEQLERHVFESGHCSALVKLTADFSQMYMAHSSWFRYQAMLRIMKHYHLPTRVSVAKKISFSSYPGFLESLDDFYLLDSGLVMLQTTNSVFDQSLYQYVVPESVFAWQRVRVGCALAHTGEEWTSIVGRYNSGTYNNQYMVIDLKRFTPGQPLQRGTLWVSEQIPGTYEASDQTAVLERGYWPSYNVAFHPKIYNLSGYPEIVAKYGVSYSYDLCPRANIFRRDQGTVVDLATFQTIMRDNNYKTDPLSKGSPFNAICSRGDLASPPSLGGCYDTKVTDYTHALQLQSWAINGPTTSHSLPPFSWAAFPSASREGMPTVFDFQFEFQDPAW
eukprot:m.232648 g.232648  ORF g.232648 m.232648 type:complete len:533 (-) comp18811_c0_seq1:170-1768(-)